MARRCGYCCNYGHNRRTCPQIQERIKEAPDSYFARHEKAKKENQAQRGPRQCSYCSETGHNKRTCSSLDTDRRNKKREIRTWRKKFVEQSQAVGFGIGTLLKLRDPDTVESGYMRDRILDQTNNSGQYAMVVALRADWLDCQIESNDRNCISLRMPDGKVRHANLPLEFTDLTYGHSSPLYEIAGRIDASGLGKLFDRNWHSGSDNVDRILGLDD